MLVAIKKRTWPMEMRLKRVMEHLRRQALSIPTRPPPLESWRPPPTQDELATQVRNAELQMLTQLRRWN